jgi:hypothetical protein
MIEIAYSEEHNVLTITYAGKIDAAQAEKFYSDIQKLGPKYKTGFKILADLSQVQCMAPETLNAVKKAMDFFNAHGVSEIIRIIPELDQDFGLNIMSLFHYSKEVKFATLNSQKEAEPHLRAWSAKKKIAFMEMKDDWQKDFLKNRLSDKKVSFFNETAQEKASELRETAILSVFINSRVDRKLMDQLPALQCINASPLVLRGLTILI